MFSRIINPKESNNHIILDKWHSKKPVYILCVKNIIGFCSFFLIKTRNVIWFVLFKINHPFRNHADWYILQLVNLGSYSLYKIFIRIINHIFIVINIKCITSVSVKITIHNLKQIIYGFMDIAYFHKFRYTPIESCGYLKLFLCLYIFF